jgi:hypothetical protein
MRVLALVSIASTVALLACRSESRLPYIDKPGPPDGPTEPTDPTDPGPLLSVVINEVMPGNQSTIDAPDSDLKPDWIELVNVGDEPVPLSELVLRTGDDDRWTGPATEVLDPGELVLLWASDELSDPLATGFTLDKDGDKLTLLDLQDRVLDFVDFDELGSDVSMARLPHATGDLQATAWPTPNAENGDAPSPTLNPADETLFVPYVMHRIDFTMSESAYNRLSQQDRPEVHVAVSIDDVSYGDVGLKLKGSASYQPMSGKPAFVLDFNEWIAGTKYRGLKAIKLHNGVVLDPTRNRDHLSYGLAREAGLLAPRVGWAQVFCNGVDYGLYILIEKHDDEFIDHRLPGQKELGVVLEPNESQGGGWGWGDFGQGNVTNWDYEEGPVPPDPATVDALVRADQLIGSQANDANVAALWDVVDKEQFLTYLAWETVVMHTDGYRSPNNWRVFVDGVTHMIQLVPAGAEWTWDSDVSAWSYGGAAGSWCLSNPGCKRDYAERLLEVADMADAWDVAGQFEDMQVWLDPYIQADPRYSGAWQTIGQARQSTREHLTDNPEEARRQVYQQYPDLRP